MAQERLGRKEWIGEATRVLAVEGLAGLKVEPLAVRLGVTKGSFYWHFRDRAELVGVVLGAWRERQTDRFIDEVEAAGGGPQERLERLWRITSTDADNTAELALREEAGRDAEVAAAVREVDRSRLAYLRSLFREIGHEPLEAEARSMLTYSLLFGDAFIHRVHGRLSRRRVLAACRELLFG